MGMLDNLSGKAGDMLGSVTGLQPTIVGAATKLLGKFGGVSGLIQAFKDKGLGGVVSSWVSTGENKPISGEQVKDVIGKDNIRDFAKEAGIPEDEAHHKIAEVLPEVVDKLTPDGKIPEGEKK